MNVEPTGQITTDDGRRVLTITREFQAPIEDVWAAVTESERLARWIGTFTGDPASGRVAFVMTAEGATEPEDMEIRECDPPRVLRVTSHVGEERWQLDLDCWRRPTASPRSTFAQPDIDPAAAENVGPGWEYYLDRLVAAETGGDVGRDRLRPRLLPGDAGVLPRRRLAERSHVAAVEPQQRDGDRDHQQDARGRRRPRGGSSPGSSCTGRPECRMLASK